MQSALELYGYLILTFLSFVTPIVAILLSVYNEGITELKKNYSQKKERIEKQIKQLQSAEELKAEEIQGGLDSLRREEKEFKKNTGFLNPQNQVIQLASWLLSSFVFVEIALLVQGNMREVVLSVIGSFLLFAYAISRLAKLFPLIMKVKSIRDRGNKEDKRVVVTQLGEILKFQEKTNDNLLHHLQKLPDFDAFAEKSFLKDVFIEIDGARVENDEHKLSIELNVGQKLTIGFLNTEDRMSKNIEIGFVFPKEFIIGSSERYSIADSGNSQIVRYKIPHVHGNTEKGLAFLSITGIKTGTHRVKTFIKAENIKTIYRRVNIEVTAKAPTREIYKGE